MGHKIPVSVLVVIHTPAHQVLLLERADRSGFWQSVTGSVDHPDEPLLQTAAREVAEETGIVVGAGGVDPRGLRDWKKSISYTIYPQWRHRYPPGVTENTEHWFSLEVPEGTAVRLAPREHLQYRWLSLEAAAAACFSPSNGDAIRELPRHAPAHRHL